jgi:SAM-dependent methyltransferase
MSFQSYTRHTLGLTGRFTELLNLSSWHRSSNAEKAKLFCQNFQAIRGELRELRGRPVSGLDVLEVGCGQRPMNLILWSRENRAVGIDSEVVLKNLSISGVLQILRTNGAMRAAKSLGRKALGLDRMTEDAFKVAIGIASLPQPDVRLMDASSMSFPDDSFDIVFSRAVFEHIADPVAVTREVRRLLRDGGTFYCLVHLYTSDSGCHDARIFSGSQKRPPSWSHLRKDYKSLVHENTFLNRWSLRQWREMFAQEMPGSTVKAMCDDSSVQRLSELRILRAEGELTGYEDDELLSPTVKVIWTKVAGLGR